jgi:hypothetical protein
MFQAALLDNVTRRYAKVCAGYLNWLAVFLVFDQIHWIVHGVINIRTHICASTLMHTHAHTHTYTRAPPLPTPPNTHLYRSMYFQLRFQESSSTVKLTFSEIVCPYSNTNLLYFDYTGLSVHYYSFILSYPATYTRNAPIDMCYCKTMIVHYLVTK